jgi:hypothetical protein
MTTTTTVRAANPTLFAALRLAAIFATVKLLLHFALTLYTQHLGYSYFRDEFYYIACGRHLAWGFVDHGPIVAVQARLGETLFGDSLFGIRILSAFAGALMIFITGIITWAMRGAGAAQALAMFALILSPQYIGVDGYLSMNSWEPVFWTLCALALFMVLRGSSPALWWTVFGISAGVGLLNKPSMTFFLVAVAVGLLCTPSRRILFSPWAVFGIVLMFVLAMPNVLWQIHNHWPTLEFLRTGRERGKNIVLGPLQFFLSQFLTLGPLNALVWIPGVIALLRAKSIRDGRWFGITFLFFYVLMDAIHAKDYYLEGIYPALFAAGGIAWENRYSLERWVFEERVFAFPVLETVLLVGGLIVLPLASPVLAPTTWVRYTTTLHLHHQEEENSSTGPLPQFFADRFGWQEQVDIVTRAWHMLTPEEQQHACLFTNDYGEAGAIDFFNGTEHLGLPPALSGQNSYWHWGTHNCDPHTVVAVVGDTQAELESKFDHVELVGRSNTPWAMPFEQHRGIWILRGRKPSFPFNWLDERYYY